MNLNNIWEAVCFRIDVRQLSFTTRFIANFLRLTFGLIFAILIVAGILGVMSVFIMFLGLFMSHPLSIIVAFIVTFVLFVMIVVSIIGALDDSGDWNEPY